MKKTIVHLVNSNIYSGLEKVSCLIIDNLKNEYEMIYVCKDGKIVEFLKEQQIKYFLIKKMSIKEIKRMLKILKPDIIHAHDYRASCIASLVKTNTLIISHLHNNPIWIRRINPYSILYLICSKRFQNILIVSKSIKKEYIFSKYIKNKFIVVNNPLNRDYILKKVNNNIKKYDICCIARLTKQKNPKRFIKIIYKLKKEYKNIKVIWVGDGELFDYSNKLIKKLHLENNITLVGFQKNPYNYLNESKIFLLTSRWEGYGLVVFEALTLGIPCVVSNVGGLKEFNLSKTGFLCNTNEEFIQSIKILLNNDYKYNLYKKESLKKSRELENENNYLKNIKKIYEELLWEKN